MRAKVRDDPLFFIKKQQQNLQKSLMDNPVKMKQLREQILREKLQEELKDKKRKSGSDIDSNDRHKKKSKRHSADGASEWQEKPRADEKHARDSEKVKYEKEVSRDMQSMRDGYRDRDRRDEKKDRRDERDRDRRYDERRDARDERKDRDRRGDRDERMDRDRRDDREERKDRDRREDMDGRGTRDRDRDEWHHRDRSVKREEAVKREDRSGAFSTGSSSRKKTQEEKLKALEQMEATAIAARYVTSCLN